MDLSATSVEIFNFFKLTLPFIFLGFFIANLIRSSSYFDLIGVPMAGIARAAKLPAKCSLAFSMYLFNAWSGLGMLAGFFKDKTLEDRQVIVSIIVSQLPKCISNIIFFLGPVGLSVFGPWTGGAMVGIEFFMCLGIAVAGMIAGRMLFNGNAREVDVNVQKRNVQPAGKKVKWKDKLKAALKDSVLEFIKISIVLVPSGALIITLLNAGIRESLASLLEPLMSCFGLPSSSLVVFAASLVSQVAAISATGTIAAKEGLPAMQCLLILVLARSIHLGIGSFRSGMPTNVALFGKSLGLKVTLIEFLTIQSGALAMILLLSLLQGM
jgi:hypothetical protein